MTVSQPRPFRYRSDYDAGTVSCLAIYVIVLVLPVIFDCDWLSITICAIGVLFMILTVWGIYYEIEDGELVIYTFFRPSRYPVDKISKIKAVRSCLSAPALSFSRLAITFSDRKILKSFLPIYVSPKDRTRFIAQLLDINPEIQVDI